MDYDFNFARLAVLGLVLTPIIALYLYLLVRYLPVFEAMLPEYQGRMSAHDA